MRWDVENGWSHTVIGTPTRVENSITEMEYDEKRDISTSRTSGAASAATVRAQLLMSLKSSVRYTVNEQQPLQARRRRSLRCASGSFPRLDVDESKVIGMAWDDHGELHAVCGAGGTFDTAKYVLRITVNVGIPGMVVSGLREMKYIHDEYRAWLKAHILPQPVPEFPETVKLPEATGRRYRAKASAVCEWHDGSKIVGTLDALAAIVRPNGKVYSLGNAAAYGPVRCMVTNAAKTKLWGVAGDEEDMGYVFTYDDDEGLRQLGILNYNSHGWFDGPTASNILSSIAIAKTISTFAIGGADRIARCISSRCKCVIYPARGNILKRRVQSFYIDEPAAATPHIKEEPKCSALYIGSQRPAFYG